MRKFTAMLAMLVFLILYAGLAATIGSALTETPRLVQLGFYVIAGIAWVFPLKPLFNWMNAADTPDR